TSLNTLAPNTSVTITYAQIWSRDTTAVHSTPGYINFFLDDVRRVQNWYAANNFPSCVSWTVSTGNDQMQLPDAKLYPNPGSELVTLDYMPQTDGSLLEIIDITGRTVQSEQLRTQQLNVFNASELQPGIYLLRVTDGATAITFRFVRQ
ncbi:MAG: T9SS type A sorting domain-containing protein, partial [Bacteroidia bacterium]